MEIQRNDSLSHEVVIGARKNLNISGVREVVSFDDESAELITVCGRLNIDGSGIKVSVLDIDKGVVSILGKIDAVYYSDDKEEVKKGFLGRLMR